MLLNNGNNIYHYAWSEPLGFPEIIQTIVCWQDKTELEKVSPGFLHILEMVNPHEP